MTTKQISRMVILTAVIVSLVVLLVKLIQGTAGIVGSLFNPVLGIVVVLALVLALLNLGVISSIQSLAWGAISGFFLAPYVFGTLGKRVTKAGAIAGSMVGLACALLIPTLVKAAFPALAPYCTTVNACAVATLLPLIVTPIVSAFTEKLDPVWLETILGGEEAA